MGNQVFKEQACSGLPLDPSLLSGFFKPAGAQKASGSSKGQEVWTRVEQGTCRELAGVSSEDAVFACLKKTEELWMGIGGGEADSPLVNVGFNYQIVLLQGGAKASGDRDEFVGAESGEGRNKMTADDRMVSRCCFFRDSDEARDQRDSTCFVLLR
jgi:hypothetical protein